MLNAFGDVIPPFLMVCVVFACVVVMPVLASLVISKVRPPAVPERAAPRASAFPAQVDRSSGRRAEEPHRLAFRPMPRFDPRFENAVYHATCVCGVSDAYLPSLQSADAWMQVHRSMVKSIDEARRQA